jgi:hypothetical protein
VLDAKTDTYTFVDSLRIGFPCPEPVTLVFLGLGIVLIRSRKTIV